MISNGESLFITHTGSKTLSSPSNSFKLNHVLCIPSMQKNLISVFKFCHQNNTFIESSPSSFFVKDLTIGTTLLQGQAKDGVYEWSDFPSQSSLIISFSSYKSFPTVWHHRLGHPLLSIYKHIVSTFGLELSECSNFNFNCNSCQCNKRHKLPFSTSSLVSHSPLEIMFSEVWTSAIYSVDGFKYYVIFMDHFTKYIWFYPLKQKSNVSEIFVRFKALLENYFKPKIVTLYSNQGGEYQALKSFLAPHGISHFTTPPHTPNHNGYSERHHRHIMETRLSFLSHASILLSYWPHAFQTVVYLINCLPTPTLQLVSPYVKIFGQPPNYGKL